MLRSIRQPLLLVALMGTAVAVPAFAQQPNTYPPPCDASKVSKGDVDRAHTVFLSGKQYLDESNYDKAISYFNDAYSIDCSVHAILPIIATAYERKGDKGEAVRALEEYLRRSPNAPDREHIERRIKNLSDQLSHAEPAASAPGTASAGTAPAAPPPSAAPEPSATPAAVPAEPPAAVAPPSHSRSPGPWIVTGVGGGATIAGVVLWIVGHGDISTAETACKGRTGCLPSVASQGNNGRTLETAGAVVGGVGLATLAGGLVWLILQKPAESPTSAAFVSPVVAPGYAGITMGSSL
jgi:tetratricopeptide (TPR) repeat protein